MKKLEIFMSWYLFIAGIATLLTIFVVPSFSQQIWERTYGGVNAERGYSAQQTSDGGYIVSGFTRSFGAGSDDIYLVKTNAAGDILWTRTYGGTGSEYSFWVQQTSDGGYIMTGWTNSFGAGNFDVYVVKTNASGDTLWTRAFGGANSDAGKSVYQTSDGGYIITGETESFGAGPPGDVWLIKTDASANILWTKTYGGVNEEVGWAVRQTPDGGFIIAGETASFGAGREDVWLIKTNATGDTLWTRTYGGTSSDRSGKSVQQTSDGGYIIPGFTESFGAGLADVYLIKTNATGDTLWTTTYGGTQPDRGYMVLQTPDGGYIVAGWTESFPGGANAYIIKTNATGDTLWTRRYGGPNTDYSYSVQLTSDGGYIIAGRTNSFGAGDYDVYLIKTDPGGVTSSETEGKSLPKEFILHQNYPNPFNPSTTIRFSLPQREHVTLKVFDVLGREVATLVNGELSAGEHSVVYDAKGLSSGVYFYRISARGFIDTKKMLISK